MKKLLILAFAVVALAQWAAPLSMIWKNEQVLKKGKVFRFLTEPVDPADPLRGRYVSLSFSADTFRTSNTSFTGGIEAYAEIQIDAKGYAYIKALYHSAPDNTSDYVKVIVSYYSAHDQNVYVNFPFEEFYMDEYKAPEAESLYFKSNSDSTANTYALVHIYKGKAVTSDLVINGKSVHDYFK